MVLGFSGSSIFFFGLMTFLVSGSIFRGMEDSGAGPNLGSSLARGLGLIARGPGEGASFEAFLSLIGNFLGFIGVLLGCFGFLTFFGFELGFLERSILLPKNIIKISPNTAAINPIKKARDSVE